VEKWLRFTGARFADICAPGGGARSLSYLQGKKGEVREVQGEVRIVEKNKTIK